MDRSIWVIVATAACGARSAPPATATPSPTPHGKVLPSYAEMVDAPECVRKVAEIRRAMADLRLSGRGTGSLPSLGEAWAKMRDTEGTFIPQDLARAWDEEIPIGVQLASLPDEAARQALIALGVKSTSGINQITFGTVPLHALVCLAELPTVKQLELNDPGREHVD